MAFDWTFITESDLGWMPVKIPHNTEVLGLLCSIAHCKYYEVFIGYFLSTIIEVRGEKRKYRNLEDKSFCFRNIPRSPWASKIHDSIWYLLKLTSEWRLCLLVEIQEVRQPEGSWNTHIRARCCTLRVNWVFYVRSHEFRGGEILGFEQEDDNV